MASARPWFLALLGLVVLALIPLSLRATEATSPERPRSPLAIAIDEAVAAERTTVAELQIRFENELDPQAAVRIQREIAHTKQQTEITVLRIQARFAREAGRTEAAEKIEASVQLLAERLEKKFPRPTSAEGER